jgi:Flp pilus assembly protein TadG
VRATRAGCERGAAVVDFVLVMVLLVPIVLGIAQVALVLHVRNTLASAASEGARSSAPLGATPADGAARTRSIIRQALADHYADDVSATWTTIGGLGATVVVVHARVPALGLLGPSVSLTVRGHAIRDVAP